MVMAGRATATEKMAAGGRMAAAAGIEERVPKAQPATPGADPKALSTMGMPKEAVGIAAMMGLQEMGASMTMGREET